MAGRYFNGLLLGEGGLRVWPEQAGAELAGWLELDLSAPSGTASLPFRVELPNGHSVEHGSAPERRHDDQDSGVRRRRLEGAVLQPAPSHRRRHARRAQLVGAPPRRRRRRLRLGGAERPRGRREDFAHVDRGGSDEDARELFDRREPGGDLGEAVVPERSHAGLHRRALDVLPAGT